MSKWNPKNLQEEALKYDRRVNFKKGSGGAVKVAYQLGIMDEICSHMKPKYSDDVKDNSFVFVSMKCGGRLMLLQIAKLF